MAINYVEIGKNVRKFRKLNNLTQGALAEQIGKTEQHISHIETASTKLGLSSVIDICNALHVDVNSILGNNVPKAGKAALSTELAALLDGASSETAKMCIELCRTVLKERK